MSETVPGLRAVLFAIGPLQIEAYPFFVLLALIVGLLIYRLELRRDRVSNPNALYIVIFALAGGIIGSKLPLIFLYWKEINAGLDSLDILRSGRTIVGGLIGGAAGTFLAKKLFGIKERLGNQIAIPVAAAMAVGRIGCLLKGCCHGIPTRLPWAINLGDGIGRHPTQIYEIVFDVILTLYLVHRKKRECRPGELFRIFLVAYLSFRFLLEYIRTEETVFLSLTAFQLLCIVALVWTFRSVPRRLLSTMITSKGDKPA